MKGEFLSMRWSLMLAAAVIFTAGCDKKVVKTGEKTTRVHVSKMEKRLFQERIPLQGTVQPVEFAVISAKISGTLEKLEASEGQNIKKGGMLFGIDRQILKNQVVVKKDEIKVREAALDSARIALDVARINLDVARNDLQISNINSEQSKRDFERADNLKKTKAISDSSWESADTDFKKAQMAVKSAAAAVNNAEASVRNAEASVRNAEAQLKQAQSNLAIAEKNLEDSAIAAPFDCVVFETYVEENEFVSTGQKILKLENQDSLEVVCFLSAVYYNRLVPGKTAVDFIDRSGKVTARSQITYKAPGVDPESRTFKIKIAVPKETQLVSGMLCELNIILTEREGFGLPEAAVLLRSGNKMIAYTVNGQKRAESVDIRRGIIDEGYAEILNAKELADKRFVVAGQTFINNGSLLVEAQTENK